MPCDSKYKRLEEGTFAVPQAAGDGQSVELSADEFGLILSGIDLAGANGESAASARRPLPGARSRGREAAAANRQGPAGSGTAGDDRHQQIW